MISEVYRVREVYLIMNHTISLKTSEVWRSVAQVCSVVFVGSGGEGV